MKTLQYQKGSVIFREGDPAQCMYEIVSGKVGIFSFYGTDSEKQLTALGPQDLFGELGLIEDYPRSATAVALEDAEVREIGVEDMRLYFRENPDQLLHVMRYTARRTRELTDEYNEVLSTLRAAVRESGNAEEKSEGLWARLLRFVGIYNEGEKRKMPTEAPAMQEGQKHSEGFAKKVLAYQKGDVVFREGDASDCMYDIHWGSVGIYTGYGTGEEKLLTRLSPNSFFGEMGMIESAPRSATAVVMEDDTHLELIYAEDLAELFEKNPRKVEMIQHHLTHRLRSLTGDYLDACRAASELAAAKQAGRELTDEERARIKKYLGGNEAR